MNGSDITVLRNLTREQPYVTVCVCVSEFEIRSVSFQDKRSGLNPGEF